MDGGRLHEWAAAIARERERRHFTIDQHRNLYGDDWPAGVAQITYEADAATDDLLAFARDLEAALREKDEGLSVAMDLLEGEGYDDDPDYRQEWKTITDAVRAGETAEGDER